MRTSHRVAVALVSCLAWLPSTAAGQESLARAKEFYASASYEEALTVLEKLAGEAPLTPNTEVASYRVYCLVALGRNDEARSAIEGIVRIDPLYHPKETEASPRVRTLFTNVRRPLLADVVRQFYTKAKDAYDRKEWPTALAEFDRVITLLDEIGTSDDPSTADLRTIAAGFRDLSKASAAPPPVAPTPAPVAPPAQPEPVAAPPVVAAAPPMTPTYGAADTTVSKPVPISRATPEWRPPNSVEAQRAYRGTLELLIGEDGKVISAVITKATHKDYDPILLKAAQKWVFKPALRNGVPVRYRYALDISLGATR
jgi:tetratricopeptide (TPR) repeat protein